MKPEQAWQAAQGQIQLEMPKAAYDTWVRDAQYFSYEDGTFVISVQNAYARDWLASRLASTTVRILTGMMNRTVEVRFIVWQDQEVEANIEPDQVSTEIEEFPSPVNQTLNARYTFENFVVGASNRLAHAASLAVAENPAQAYNPLFIYGGVGLGKTHLLHAIGNFNAARGLEILYVSSEEFTNDLINAIRAHKTQAFREKYRRIDVLLIDDIQFIAGKESTQEEFFHTFNTLHGQDKQIIITSDRPPKALITLEERLRSRFEWGLTADLQPPDFETRMAILRSKAERAGRKVPGEIIEVIARRVQSNIRELEGALTRVVAFVDLSGLPLTPIGIQRDRMLSRDRSREVALPRQIAMYLMREESNISLPLIGETLGGRDHTTIMYGCDKIADLLERDDRLRRQVIEIRETLYGQVNI
jgi:chromosomal replication initiator protein